MRPWPTSTRPCPIATLGACVLAIFSGCTQAAVSDRAPGARMRVEGAQFVPGSMPSTESGPSVAALDLTNTTIWPGYANKLIRGSLDASATAAALALSEDEGYWIVSAGVPDYTTPTLPTFRVTASFSSTLLAGSYNLAVRAVDAAGSFGPPRLQALTALAAPPSALADSTSLEVVLTWDSEADLDVHVVDPLGSEIYHGDKTTLEAFAVPTTTASAATGSGLLDIDSNADCNIDGRRRERVLWSGTPPSGHYLVRVDAKSLCGVPIAYWTIKVMLGGASLTQANGVSVDSDTWGAHDRGAGLLAVAFDLP